MTLYTIALHKLKVFFAKKQLESLPSQLGKTALVKTGAYIVSRDRNTTVYRLEAHFLKTHTKLFIATCSRISLTCL